MKAEDNVGDFYVPEGESRTLQITSDWFWYRAGTLILMARCEELDAEEPLLLRQYSADQLFIQLLAVEPDPSDWVRVTRYEGGRWDVENDEIEELDDAM